MAEYSICNWCDNIWKRAFGLVPSEGWVEAISLTLGNVAHEANLGLAMDLLVIV